MNEIFITSNTKHTLNTFVFHYVQTYTNKRFLFTQKKGANSYLHIQYIIFVCEFPNYYEIELYYKITGCYKKKIFYVFM